MKFSRGLPLLLSPSIFPVTTMFSSPCFLMICPRKHVSLKRRLRCDFLSVKLPTFTRLLYPKPVYVAGLPLHLCAGRRHQRPHEACHPVDQERPCQSQPGPR